jgi:hypothetical protein
VKKKNNPAGVMLTGGADISQMNGTADVQALYSPASPGRPASIRGG